MDKEMEYKIITTQKRSFEALYQMFEATSRFCVENAPDQRTRMEMVKLVVSAGQLHDKFMTISDGYMLLKQEGRESL